ncbi:hypothetical protein KP509_07G031300 [Ceratopteris richardii]|uniref:Uncharacterized protein n=1 Tax=Ceratopteris richardii TaxID=49495 RepID=A0A8T2UGJ5_CERRI|nr:hypothetical protein KP509_07G031300 [Ceratopteris richardii]
MYLIYRSGVLVSGLELLPCLISNSQALYIGKDFIRDSHFNVCYGLFIQSGPCISSMLFGFTCTREPSQSLKKGMLCMCSFHKSKLVLSNLLTSKRFFMS